MNKLDPLSYLNLIKSNSINNNFSILSHLLSLQTIIAIFNENNQHDAMKDFFTQLLSNYSQFPSNYPFSNVINAHILSSVNVWFALDCINTTRTHTEPTIILPSSTTFNDTLRYLSDASASIDLSLQSMHEHIKAGLPAKRNIPPDNLKAYINSTTNEIVQWRTLLNTILFQYRLISRLTDTITSLDIVRNRTQEKIFDFDDLALTSSKALVQLSTSLRGLIATIESDTRNRLYQPLSLSTITQSILTYFSHHSSQYSANVTQLEQLLKLNQGVNIIEQYPLVDQIQYYYCLGRAHVMKREYPHANFLLTRAFQLCISYPGNQFVGQTIGSNQLTMTSQTPLFSLTSTTTSQLNREYLHNVRLIVKLLCPLRLAFSSGNFSPQNSLYSTQENGPLLLDGLFSPSFLEAIELPIFAKLSRAVINGDLYLYNYLIYKHVGHFISSGVYSLIQSIAPSVWLHLISILHSRLLSQPNVIRWNVVLLALRIQKERKIQTVQFDPDYVLEDYDANDVECAMANLIYSSRIRAYYKPGVALVLSKNDPFSPTWDNKRKTALNGQFHNQENGL